MNVATTKSLILYIGSSGIPNLTIEKLACMMFFIDMQAYLQLGYSITGATYVHGRRCPYPKGISRIILGMRRDGEMEASKARF